MSDKDGRVDIYAPVETTADLRAQRDRYRDRAMAAEQRAATAEAACAAMREALRILRRALLG